jgi:hypothetical protein
MDAGERVGFDLVGVENFGHVFDFNQRNCCFAHMVVHSWLIAITTARSSLFAIRSSPEVNSLSLLFRNFLTRSSRIAASMTG